MLNILTEEELRTTQQLIQKGLAKSAISLEQIINSPIEVNSIQYVIEDQNGVPQYSTKTGRKVHLIKTEIIGDLKGICHLVFSQEEVEKVQEKCLPKEIMAVNSPETRLMKLEFLTEIDNILAASMIAQFANHLNLKMYGHVPSLQVMKSNELNSFIYDEAVSMNSSVQFKATLCSSELEIMPEFIWLFKEDFIQYSREYALQAG